MGFPKIFQWHNIPLVMNSSTKIALEAVAPPTSDLNARFMRLALAQAGRAAVEGEVPIGAVLVQDGKVIARGYNRPIIRHDPTAHAEIVAIRLAAKKAGNYRLTGCDLYVTVEPCAMCLGAILNARIRRLIYGADDPKSGAVRSIVRFPIEKTNHRVEIVSGVLADDAAALLRSFFRARRARS
jgi:tRNA(adenine34) deaminase